MFDQIDELAVNGVRMLSLDAINAAKSGHPGLPLGVAPLAYVLWSRHMTVNPRASHWFNRDRFVLSAGHGSAMLYSLLHLSGYQLTVEDLQHFRQLGSRTPGHPEYGWTDGVEATTGPLGQGLGMAVGMAMAERHVAARYNRPGFKVVDHRTYVVVGDGDLMEGISHEAASLAGQLQLNKLIVLYDSNDVSLDGPLSNACQDNVQKRFESYGWAYQRVEDGTDLEAIDAAIDQAKEEEQRPTLIEVKTVIGAGSPQAGTNKVHGAPLSEEALAATKAAYQWSYEPFKVPGTVYERFAKTIGQRGSDAERAWNKLMVTYEEQCPALASAFADDVRQRDHVDLSDLVTNYHDGDQEATRLTSEKIIQAASERNSSLWGGTADLFSSNKTAVAASGRFDAAHSDQRNVWFGVREFAEGCALNGIALHGGSRIFGSTFFVFSDYMRGAIRLAALQKLPVTYVLTHDSIAVGEDGPTHEPVEQLAGLRALPGLNVIRPADANETIAAWQQALSSRHQPTALILTRQAVPVLAGARAHPEGVSRGGYVISPQQGVQPSGLLLASGSEVQLALAAQKTLRQRGHDVAVISMPCMELFNAQPAAYRERVLPSAVRQRVAIEMGTPTDWAHYVGLDGQVIGMTGFGASGNGAAVVKHFHFTAETVVATYETLTANQLRPVRSVSIRQGR